MKAILSDIHGNLEALQAILEDAARYRAEELYCLGDLVGYGPNPRECVDLAMRWRVVLLGNFDEAVLLDPPSLGPTAVTATRSLVWSRSELDLPIPDSATAERRLGFLAGLPRQYQEGDLLFVHGSPRNPLREYVFPEDVYNEPKMGRLFGLIGRYCFHGHTHVPGIVTEGFEFLTPESVGHVYRLNGRKALVNVGSVGQPRDGDWRACYTLLGGDAVCFRRVEYDIDTTMKKIRYIGDLDDFLGDRLGDGR
jgi:diadenosine tetraphosphatase ApaH/serine/threonine PP2A family protein phosphatase